MTDRPQIERPRGTHDVVPAEMPQLAAGHGRDRAALRALRLPEDPDARVRGHGALRAHLGRRLGRRAEGDVHLHRPLRPVAHAPAGGHRADLPGVRRARDAPRPAAREAVHDRVDVPLRRARPGPLPRALAGVGRGARHRTTRDRRGADPALRHAARAARRDALPPRAQLDRLPRLPAGVPRDARARWLAENGDRLDEETRAKVDVSPLRVFDNYLAKPPAVREALDEAPTIGESLCEACVEHFAAVRADLDAMGVAYALVPTLVRGLDYYTRTTFEFIGPLENQNSTITGGGPLRLPHRGDRRAADARDRLRRRHRAAAHRDGGGGRRGAARARHRRLPRARRRVRRASASRRGWQSCGARASRPRPTTRAARSRAS